MAGHSTGSQARTKRSCPRWAWWLALLGAVLAVGLVGWRHASPPQYCADGLDSLRDAETGARRCCGHGQALAAGRCVRTPSACARGMRVTQAGCLPEATLVAVAGGTLRLSPIDWEAPGTVTAREVAIEPFRIESHEVIEADYEACVAAGSCESIELRGEPGLPVTGATRAESERYCQWRGGRLPTSDEHVFAAMGPDGRRYPWGDTGAVCRRAAFGLAHGPCAQGSRGPELAGSRLSGATADGIHDLAGNVAEWTGDADPSGRDLGAVRGGSWQDSAAHALRSWSVRWIAATTRSNEVGWRCAFAATR
jgi:formylglycine-generating enzyme required for sulfatase activity